MKCKLLYSLGTKTLIAIGATLFGILVFLLITTSLWIGLSVRNSCDEAQMLYEGDCYQALVEIVIDSDQHTLKERNHAVWALGQLGDRRALPELKKLYTGQDCDHDRVLCQYELKKAIDLLEGGFNITAFIWRNSYLIN